MNEVLEERRFVVTWVTSRESLVDVALNVPVSVDIARVVGLDAASLNLLETPLRQVDVSSPKIAAKVYMLQTNCSGESADLPSVA